MKKISFEWYCLLIIENSEIQALVYLSLVLFASDSVPNYANLIYLCIGQL